MKAIRLLMVVVLAVAVAVAIGGAGTAEAAASCTITTQTAPTMPAAKKVSWTWAVSCTGLTGSYNVYTDALDVTTGKAYGTLGTGSPLTAATSGATETKTIPTCVPAELWNVKVAVRNATGTLLAGPTVTAPSKSLCPSTPPPPTGPTTPTNLQASVAGDTEIDLSWTASTDQAGTIQGYNVYRDGTKLAPAATGTTFADTGLQPGTPHTYTVEAFDLSRPAPSRRRSPRPPPAVEVRSNRSAM